MKILSAAQAIKVSKDLKNKNKRVVLVGGCFDILHTGHIEFLKRAKEKGNVLFVLLESDIAIKKFKGDNRPINSQKDRAEILSNLGPVDYVIKLPGIFKDNDYDQLMTDIKPDILATTQGDSKREHKERQAKKIGAKVIDVIEKIPSKSTSKIIKLLDL